MTVSPKTIYLEADEEITSVIDKIRKTEYSDIILVVPKGASISQSVVNLKLIKKKAEDLDKTLSIVTGDKVARNLAEKIGILTASTTGGLGAASEIVHAATSEANEAAALIETNEVIGEKPATEAFTKTSLEPEEYTITEGEEDDIEASSLEPRASEYEDEYRDSSVSGKERGTTSNLMPRFPWKKVILFAGIPLVVLLIVAYIYLPRGRATIYMKSESKMVSINISGDNASKLDTEKAVVPSQVVEVTKESSNKFPASGKKDAGTKATGTVEVYYAGGAVDWVAGTRLYLGSDSSLVYKTTGTLHAPKSVPTQVQVAAENPGEKYNIASNKTFLAVNDSSPTVTSVTAMTGGSTKQVTIVTQGDINSAKDTLSKDTTTEAMAEFASKTSDLKVVDDSKKTEVVSATASPAVDQEATDFTLTVKVTVKAVAVNMNDLKSLIKSEVTRQLGSALQIIDDGSSKLTLSIDTVELESGKISGTVKTTAYVAKKLDENKIKAELTGLNDTQAKNYISSLDGVDSSKLEYFPSFIRSFPRIKDNIYLFVTIPDSLRN